MKKALTQPHKLPIIFHFNIRRSTYEAFGLSNFDRVQSSLRCHMLPIINDMSTSIQTRADNLKQQLLHKMDKLKAEKVHLVSYSLAGLDTRYAINSLGCSQYVNSLLMVATPNKGSKLADIYEKKGLTPAEMNPIARLTGVSSFSFLECVPQNIKSFNEVVTNSSKVQYFTMGGEKTPEYASGILRKSNRILRDLTKLHLPYENDGVFGHDEIVWGRHLVNFQYDHAQILGIGGGCKGQPFELIKDTLKMAEQISDKMAAASL